MTTREHMIKSTMSRCSEYKTGLKTQGFKNTTKFTSEKIENKTRDVKRWEKVSVDGLISCAVSSKLTAIHQLVFVYMKTQYVNYSKNPKDTVWDNHERETQNILIA